jgi:adenosylmethionine-8-amino-7-oxononanoate aminotransferase
LTRPILDVIVLMLPLCATEDEIDLAIEAIRLAIAEVCGER